MGTIIYRHHEPHRLAGPRAELIEPNADIPLTLEAINTTDIEEKIQTYSPNQAGFDQFCLDLVESRDPRAIQVLLFLADNHNFAANYFRCNTARLFEPAPYVDFIPNPTVIEALLQKHPEFFTLFVTEVYKHTLAQPQTEATEWIIKHNRAAIADCIAGYFYYYSDHPEELSRDQFHYFIDTLIEYLAHDGYFISDQAAAHFINRYDPDYAAQKLTARLHKKELPPVGERSITGLLACLDVAPATVVDDSCRYLGVDIRLDGLPSGAKSAERLSIYGNVGIINVEGEIIGQFSVHELEPDEQQTFRALVRELELSDLFFQTQAEGAIPQAEQAALAQEFKTAYRHYADHQFFAECRVPLHTFPLKEQIGLIRLLRAGDADLIEAVQTSTRQFGKAFLRACAITYIYSGNLHDLMVREPHTAIKPSLAEFQPAGASYLCPIDYFVRFAQQAETTAGVMYTELRRQYPDIELNVEDIVRGLMSRAVTALSQIADVESANAYRTVLQDQAADVTLGLTYFREIIGLVKQTEIDLTQCVRRQQALLRLAEHNPALHGVLVDALLQGGKLRPDKDLFWRVDRPIAEHNERTGVNIITLAQALAEESTGKEILFEPGAGCGKGIAERSSILSDKYYDFSINDRAYYPLRQLLTQCIDFEALARTTGTALDAADQALFVDYIYKVLYLTPGAGGDGPIDVKEYYDVATIAAITEDPNNLKTLLPELGVKLQLAEAVPSEHGIEPQASGSQIYPNKIRLSEQSSEFQAAFQAFCDEPDNFLDQAVLAGDLKQQIPVFPIGMMLGDFSEIDRLKSNQIKFAEDVRAVVYLEGEQYINFLVTMGDKLKAGGIYVSDSIRENFGKVYRLPEVVQAQKQLGTGYTFYVVTGPGVPGDDLNQTAAVRSVIICKGDDRADLLPQHLTTSAYVLQRLEDITNNEEYVRSLDKTGANWARLQATFKAAA